MDKEQLQNQEIRTQISLKVKTETHRETTLNYKVFFN